MSFISIERFEEGEDDTTIFIRMVRVGRFSLVVELGRTIGRVIRTATSDSRFVLGLMRARLKSGLIVWHMNLLWLKLSWSFGAFR